MPELSSTSRPSPVTTTYSGPQLACTALVTVLILALLSSRLMCVCSSHSNSTLLLGSFFMLAFTFLTLKVPSFLVFIGLYCGVELVEGKVGMEHGIVWVYCAVAVHLLQSGQAHIHQPPGPS